MAVITTRARTVVLVVALALAASLLTLAVVLAKPAQAQAETIIKDNDRTTFEFGAFGCTEGVLVEGTQHTVAHTMIDANGGFHSTFRFNIQGQGEGLESGDKYVFQTVFNDHTNATGPFERTLTQTTNVIHQGEATTTDDDLQATIVLHVTVNAQGQITSQVENVDLDCFII